MRHLIKSVSLDYVVTHDEQQRGIAKEDQVERPAIFLYADHWNDTRSYAIVVERDLILRIAGVTKRFNRLQSCGC